MCPIRIHASIRPIRFAAFVTALVAAVALSATPSWSSSTLPAPFTLAECTAPFFPNLIDDPTSCTLGGASGSLTLLPFVSLTAHASSAPANPNFIDSAGVFVTVKYSFQVEGGQPGDVVPILITTNLGTTASSFGHSLGFAETVIHSSFGNTSVAVCTNGTCGTNATSFSGTFSSSAMSGEAGDTIQLEIEAVSGDSPLAESASAFADPEVFIDPSFANAGLYSIIFSPGVGNGIPAVPEPGTLPLLSLGGVALFFVRRRATSKSAPQL